MMISHSRNTFDRHGLYKKYFRVLELKLIDKTGLLMFQLIDVTAA